MGHKWWANGDQRDLHLALAFETARRDSRWAHLISPPHGGDAKQGLLGDTWFAKGRMFIILSNSKMRTPTYHPQLQDHHLIRAHTQRGASAQNQGQPSGKMVLTQQNTSGTKGWCRELTSDPSPSPQNIFTPNPQNP